MGLARRRHNVKGKQEKKGKILRPGTKGANRIVEEYIERGKVGRNGSDDGIKYQVWMDKKPVK